MGTGVDSLIPVIDELNLASASWLDMTRLLRRWCHGGGGGIFWMGDMGVVVRGFVSLVEIGTGHGNYTSTEGEHVGRDCCSCYGLVTALLPAFAGAGCLRRMSEVRRPSGQPLVSDPGI